MRLTTLDVKREDIKKTIQLLRDNPIKTLDETHIFQLAVDDFNRVWALVLAWQEDFEEIKDNNPYHNGDKRICMKVAYKNKNSIMDEYDMDWFMPHMKLFVDSCEVSIENEEGIDDRLDFMEETFEHYKKTYFDVEDWSTLN